MLPSIVLTWSILYSYNALNPVGSSNDEVNIGEEFIDPANKIYDANGFASYLVNADLSRTLSVAFSETLDETIGTPVFTPADTANIVPTNFVVNNHVAIDDNGTTVNADLVNFDLTDVYTFALEEGGAVLDFTGSITDPSGNVAVADANAKVVVRDLIPPMVASTKYDGRNLVVAFDKAIDIDSIDTPTTAMSLNGVSSICPVITIHGMLVSTR